MEATTWTAAGVLIAGGLGFVTLMFKIRGERNKEIEERKSNIIDQQEEKNKVWSRLNENSTQIIQLQKDVSEIKVNLNNIPEILERKFDRVYSVIDTHRIENKNDNDALAKGINDQFVNMVNTLLKIK